MMRHWRKSAAFAAMVLVSFSRGEGVPPARDPFEAMNLDFRAAYARERSTEANASSPAILSQGDRLVLLRAGKREEVLLPMARYKLLKAVAHVSLALFVMTKDPLPEKEAAARIAELESYRMKVVAADKALCGQGLPPDLLARQKSMLADSLTYLNEVVRLKRFDQGSAARFSKSMTARIQQNLFDASKNQIEELDGQISTWKKELSTEEWNRLIVVVMGQHMARTGNLAMQYFSRVLPPPIDDRRLIYAEGVSDDGRALQLLGTVVLDTKVGAAFFDDPLRMHRDVLADSATQILKSHSPEQRK